MINFNLKESTSKVLSNNPGLYELISATESMDNLEKQHWFDILPSMNKEQTDRLIDILETERKKLEELNN